LQPADKHYRFGYATSTILLPPFTKTKLTLSTTALTNRTPTPSLPKKPNFLFLDCLVSRDNNELRTTVYGKPTHTDRLLDQSSYNPTSHKATNSDETSATFVTAYVTKTNTLNVFFTRTITKLTLLNETFTDLPKLSKRTGIPHLLVQCLYLTLRAPLKPSHGSYSPATSV